MPDPCLHVDKFSSFESTLEDIKDLVTATNGRVRALEMWKVGITTAVSVLGIVILWMLAVLGPKLTAVLTGMMAVEAAAR